MGLYFTDEFILSKVHHGAIRVIPIPRQSSALTLELIRVTKAIPSIKTRIEEIWDKQELGIGSITDSHGYNGAACSFVAMNERARDVVSVNSVVETLISLSKNLPRSTGRYVIGPLATKEQIPAEVMKKLISGIFQDHPEHVTFTVDE